MEECALSNIRKSPALVQLTIDVMGVKDTQHAFVDQHTSQHPDEEHRDDGTQHLP